MNKVEDTCCCGAKFNCENKFPNLFPKDTKCNYDKWLEAHKGCREASTLMESRVHGGRRKADKVKKDG